MKNTNTFRNCFYSFWNSTLGEIILTLALMVSMASCSVAYGMLVGAPGLHILGGCLSVVSTSLTIGIGRFMDKVEDKARCCTCGAKIYE